MKKSVLALVVLSLFVSLKAEDIMVLAAASLKFVLEDVKKEFLSDRKGDNIEVSYIASGKAYNQIINGAPAHLFIAADTGYPQKLYEEKGAPSAPVNYVKGKLVLFTTNKDIKLDSMESLRDKKITKIALPNPKLAPYGVAGKEAMDSIKIYDELEPKIVLGESINQAYQYVQTGASEVGFNALSMVIKDKDVKYITIDEKTYNPIKQAMVITNYGKDSKLAKEFSEFILSDKGQAIFESYGYDKP